MQIEDGYPAITRALKRLILTDRDVAKAKYFMNAEALALDMRYPSQHNQELYDLIAAPDGAYLRIQVAQLVAAQKARQRQQQAEAKQRVHAEAKQKQAEADAEAKRRDAEARLKQHQKDAVAREAAKEKRRQEREAAKRAKAEARQMETIDMLQAELGGVPTTEREFVALKVAKDGLRMTFDRQFSNAKSEVLTGEQVLLDLHLCAADLGLVKPRGDLLAATNIDRAMSEWCITERADCIERVCERVIALPSGSGVSAETVIADFERIASFYWKEGRFAATAVRKFIWQVKRMLVDLPHMGVEWRHMLVFVGEQGSGKTFVQRRMTQPIKELVAEASLKDVLDERQMELPNYGVILLDELVGGDKADHASLKNFVTGSDWARRPMRSNVIQKIKVRASLMGTSNHSLGKVIFDSSGARRFIELEVKPRIEIEPYWDQIMGFDWELLWQAVDVEADDPLMNSEFVDLLRAKQEELRNADNSETWLMQYEPSRTSCKNATHEFIEWFASELYEDFARWEKEYDRGWRGTSLARWGRDMKSLIDSGRATGWSCYKYGAKTVYRVNLESSGRNFANTVVRPPWMRNKHASD